jgi:hypothetical protein
MCNHDLKRRSRLNGRSNGIAFVFLFCENCGYAEFVSGDKKLFNKQFKKDTEGKK